MFGVAANNLIGLTVPTQTESGEPFDSFYTLKIEAIKKVPVSLLTGRNDQTITQLDFEGAIDIIVDNHEDSKILR